MVKSDSDVVEIIVAIWSFQGIEIFLETNVLKPNSILYATGTPVFITIKLVWLLPSSIE